ncbi:MULTISPECIES: hypothetical protein [unclassified Nocardiopsis]|uniref:hypothetical protein n=1 Tax=unclassified Nocardiopsis TaxID=2649073 RepID=UPI001357ECF3|nr:MULTISPECIES: hypothetical protein [unclassified Nocardiopsis]
MNREYTDTAQAIGRVQTIRETELTNLRETYRTEAGASIPDTHHLTAEGHRDRLDKQRAAAREKALARLDHLETEFDLNANLIRTAANGDRRATRTRSCGDSTRRRNALPPCWHRNAFGACARDKRPPRTVEELAEWRVNVGDPAPTLRRITHDTGPKRGRVVATPGPHEGERLWWVDGELYTADPEVIRWCARKRTVVEDAPDGIPAEYTARAEAEQQRRAEAERRRTERAARREARKRRKDASPTPSWRFRRSEGRPIWVSGVVYFHHVLCPVINRF